jgi:hypothetical protein
MMSNLFKVIDVWRGINHFKSPIMIVSLHCNYVGHIESLMYI